MINNFIFKSNNRLIVYFPFILGVLPKSAMTSSSAVVQDGGQFSISFVTVPNEVVAKSLSRELVKNKLAACVNIIPGVTSVYEWKGEINEDSELILKIKTRTSLVHQLTDFVKKNHPYDVCEVISIPIQGGNPEYLKWIDETVKSP